MSQLYLTNPEKMSFFKTLEENKDNFLDLLGSQDPSVLSAPNALTEIGRGSLETLSLESFVKLLQA